jgi:gamma-glutamyl phosphate reductase
MGQVLWIRQSRNRLCSADITLYGGEKSTRALGLPDAPSPKHEYGSLALTLELVDSMDEAIEHIHKFGSAHTESIVTGAETWAVDSMWTAAYSL